MAAPIKAAVSPANGIQMIRSSPSPVTRSVASPPKTAPAYAPTPRKKAWANDT